MLIDTEMAVYVCVFTSLIAHQILSQECCILQRITRGGLYVVGLTFAAREKDSSYSAKLVELLSVVGNEDLSLKVT